jgi:ABC-type transporter Mla subunit MlaD
MAAESGTQGIGDLFALIGGNPFASMVKNVENFRAAVDGSLAALANLNRTLESLDGVARRVASLLDDVEGPVRTLVPHLTKISEQSLQLFEQIADPLDRVAPGLDRLADTLTSPMFAGMPAVLGDFLDTLRDLAARLRPLGQMAEAAGAMFGMRGLTALRLAGGGQEGTAAAATPPPATAGRATAAPAQAGATKAPAQKAPAKKAPAKKAPAKKAAAKSGAATSKRATTGGTKPAVAGRAGSASADPARRMTAGRRPGS